MATFGSDWNYSITGAVDYNWFDNDDTNQPLSDEEILERMDIKVIEKFLREKKLEKLEKLKNV